MIRHKSNRHWIKIHQNVSWFVLLCLLLTFPRTDAQEAAGGSIKDFKKPGNPPVYGGRIPKGTKVNSTKPDAVDPESTKSKGVVAGARSGGLVIMSKRSGGGGAASPTVAASAPAAPAPKPTAPASTEVNQQVEDAIAEGNAARGGNPPNYEAAENAYRLAAKLAPNDVRPYEGLGNIFIDQKRYEDAFTAYQQAVKLGSKNPEVFESLSDSYLGLGRFTESLDASTRSISLNPQRPGPYFTRAWVNLYLMHGAAAGDDARAMLAHWQPAWTGEQPFYIALVGHFGYRQAGRSDDADKLLAEAAKACTSTAWVCQALKYLSHEQSADELLARSNDADKLTEAHTYIGVDLALAGRREDALPHLEWVKANGRRDFYEYPLALAWLAAK